MVRAARRRRVRAIDRDLPLVLELLATMAQAGLGLDSAIVRIVEVQPPERPLTIELRAFQHDLLAGLPRLQAMRHLAGRIDVTSLTVFVAGHDLLRRSDREESRLAAGAIAAQCSPGTVSDPIALPDNPRRRGYR